MAKIHRGATLTPHFRDFVPPWLVRQQWYVGPGVPQLVPVGYFRMEDPAGEVGMETHLVSDGSVIYQVPMTYRGAPLVGAAGSLIATTEHSVLGTRWIYDGLADPVWVEQWLSLVRTEGVSELSVKPGTGPAEARGRLLARPEALTSDAAVIDLKRVVSTGEPADQHGVLGMVTGTWYPLARARTWPRAAWPWCAGASGPGVPGRRPGPRPGWRAGRGGRGSGG